MKLKSALLLVMLLFSCMYIYGQDEFLYSSDGRTILKQREFIANCLKGLKKGKSDPVALSICECQVDQLNRRVSYNQFKKYTTKGVIDIAKLITEDSVISKRIYECIKNTGQSTLLLTQSNRADMIANCMKSIQENTKKKSDSIKLNSFCTCQVELITTKKINDSQLESLNDPNSLLRYEMMYKCGNPFEENDDDIKDWNKKFTDDIKGPNVDTVNILNLNGMTYVKVKTGSLIQVWLLDTGASDFMISTEMEKILRNEKIITDDNFLGVREYEMANGTIDYCRRYRINNVKIGLFSIDNVIIAVSEKGKKIIVGKTLLNKFSKWSLDNKLGRLILWKE